MATLFLVGGCSDEPEAKRPGPAGPTASSDQPTRTPATQSPGLDLPGNAQILVAETTGNKDQELPEFTSEEGAYTVYAVCEGKGKVSILNRNSSNAHPVACGGVPTVGVIYADKKAQHLKIQVVGDTSVWKIAVISGNHQS
ncbi:hypothetical protein ACFPZI_06070 [Streptomyces chlorus]|uniref:Lipoprotein n=1 Tax=Streptomyces chlorus TaxID=887452 RepID=A0ABW1DS44_9ACTN